MIGLICRAERQPIPKMACPIGLLSACDASTRLTATESFMAGMNTVRTASGGNIFYLSWDSVLLRFSCPRLWDVAFLFSGFLEKLAVQREQRLVDHTRCRQCGYDLRATPERCPECGLTN